jgi:hypothetical protein
MLVVMLALCLKHITRSHTQHPQNVHPSYHMHSGLVTSLNTPNKIPRTIRRLQANCPQCICIGAPTSPCNTPSHTYTHSVCRISISCDSSKCCSRCTVHCSYPAVICSNIMYTSVKRPSGHDMICKWNPVRLSVRCQRLHVLCSHRGLLHQSHTGTGSCMLRLYIRYVLLFTCFVRPR